MFYIPEEPPVDLPRDEKTDEAKAVLMTDLFDREPARVVYERQVEVLFEGRFFHWITARALKELVAERRIGTHVRPLGDRAGPFIRFYWPRRHRYWRREAETIRKVVLEFSQTWFGRALGRHGETMFDAALPRAGFLPSAVNVRSWGGKEWAETEHDLDRVFERDGIAYGAEIKNTLDYIEREELKVKLDMCDELGVKPLFIVRMAPRSYIETVRQRGGFTLVFQYQLYPHGQEALARRVRETLGLPWIARRPSPTVLFNVSFGGIWRSTGCRVRGREFGPEFTWGAR